MNALALGLVTAAGAVALSSPFSADQALFTVFGRELTRGAVLYRDLFDVKQPAIFWFYAAGGSLFGFTEVGIHLFELVYWLGFSIFAVLALRSYLTTWWGPPLIPVFTVVAYYLSAAIPDLTQIEILVAFPILFSWWLVDGATPGTRSGVRRYAAAGLLAAILFLFKHIYLLIVIAFVVHGLLRSRRWAFAIRESRRSLVAFLLCLATPLLAIAVYFGIHGQLGRIFWAYFDLGAAQLSGTKPVGYLAVWLRGFLIGHGAIVILAVFGCLHGLMDRAGRRRNLVAAMVLWLVLGAGAFFAQGWYEYKLLLFSVPLGVLAVIGIEAVVSIAARSSRMRRRFVWAAFAGLALVSFLVGRPPRVQTLLLTSVVIGCCVSIVATALRSRPNMRQPVVEVLLLTVAVSAGLMAIEPANKVDILLRHGFALTVEERADLRRSLSASYRAVDRDLESLGPRLRPGPLQVFGDPVVQLRANRRQATPFVSLRPELYDSRAWIEVYVNVRSTLPPTMLIDDLLDVSIRSRCPALMELIRFHYDVVLDGVSGTWYARRDLATSDLPGGPSGPALHGSCGL